MTSISSVAAHALEADLRRTALDLDVGVAKFLEVLHDRIHEGIGACRPADQGGRRGHRNELEFHRLSFRMSGGDHAPCVPDDAMPMPWVTIVPRV